MKDEKRKPTRDVEGSILKRIEERRTANGKTRKETVYYARVRQNEYDENGELVRLHELKRRAATYADAVILRRKIRLDLKAKIDVNRAGNTEKRIYFFDLLDFYEKHYVKAAVFSGTKKIAGQRTPLHQTRRMIKTFREFFGNIPVASISYSRIFDFKITLLETKYKITRKVLIPNPDPKVRKKTYKYVDEWRDRKPATAHRYLACLRRILYIGIQQGFATVNPFKLGDPLIVASIEDTRTRICSFEEEEQLLAECTGPREHLKNVIICAIDTFLRENELFSLIGSDIDFESRFVSVREKNSKTLKNRTVPLTDRSYEAFLSIRGDRAADEWDDRPVFPFQSVKTAWYTILSKTEIDDLHFHDLRGTGITRMLDAGVPVPIVMKFSGHTQYGTFMKYVKKDLRIIQDAGVAMSDLYEKRIAEISKGQTPLTKGRDTLEEGDSEVTDLGDSLN